MKKLLLLLSWLVLTASWVQGQAPAAQPAAASGPTGSIKGRIFDAKTKEPLVGATILVVGTYKGAQADFDGNFLIKGVKPGDYTIKINMTGYTSRNYNGIRVKADVPTDLNAGLNEYIATKDVVEIVGERPMVDLESGKSEVRISAADIKEMNVRNVQDVVAMQAGVTKSPDGLQIRGGRVYETQYVVDGISASDPLAGTGFGVEVSSGAVQDVNVITGGSDAEYNGTSGVILTRIKEGGDKFAMSASWQRDHATFRREDRRTANSGTGWNTDIAELNIGGPVPGTGGKLRYFFGGNLNLTDDYFRIYANQLKSSIVDDNVFGIGVNRTTWSPRQNNKWSGTAKFSWDASPKTRITLTNQYSLLINQSTRTLQIVGFDAIMDPGLQYAFSLNMDNATTYTHRSNLTALNINHRVNENWILDGAFGRLFVNLRADANGRPFRPESVNSILDPGSITTDPVNLYVRPQTGPPVFGSFWNYPYYIFALPGPGFVNNGGISSTWHDHYVQELTGRVKATYFSPSKRHFLSFGMEHKEQEMVWVDVDAPWFGAPIQLADGSFTQSTRIGRSNDIWRVSPSNGSLFVQDEITYKGIKATLGLRMEYWAPGKFADNAVDNPNAVMPQSIRDDYKAQTVPFLDGRRYKARLLPKLRVSFPITENNVLYFNYGHAMRLPHPRFVYAGLDPEFQKNSIQNDLGNPNVNPEVAVSYELGLKSQVTRDFGVTATAFYKDYFDFIVTNRTIEINTPQGPQSYSYSINQDYARVRGVELGLNYRLSKSLRATFNGSYQIATGKSNTAAESRLQIRTQGNVNLTREQFLAWDRPFEFKGGVIFTPDTTIYAFRKLSGFRLFVFSTFKSGFRYTPFRQTGVRDDGRPIYDPIEDQPFSKISAPWFFTDMRLTYDVKMPANQKLSFSIEVNNVFNNLNAQVVNPLTGNGYTYGDQLPIGTRDPNYPNPDDGGTPADTPARWLPPRQIMFGVAYTIR